MCYDFKLSDGSTTISSNASQATTPQKSTSGRRKKSKAPKGAVTPKLPTFESHEEKADFMINVFKVKLCTRRRRHTWSGCPYAHVGETAKRRDPNTHHAVPCPEMKQGNRCPRGDHCPYSHHDFEYWLHPARYCTVMCNKGPRCDRSLCFFAHNEKELRSCPTSTTCDHTTTISEECLAEQRTDIHDASSAGDINFEHCMEDMKSSASLTSVADSFRSTYDRFQDPAVNRKAAIPASEPINDYPPSLFLGNNLPNIESIAMEHASQTPQALANGVLKALPSAGFNASSDICHLLSHPQAPALGDPGLSQGLPPGFLQKSFSTGQASHFSPTCHFSGLAGKFATSHGIQTLPSCPATFDLVDARSNQAPSQVTVSMPTTQRSYPAHPLAHQNDPLHIPSLASIPATANNHKIPQAMDSFQGLHNEELLAQTAALENLATSTSMLRGSSSQDLLCNVEMLQLLKLQLLCTMQGGAQASPLTSSYFDPTCSSRMMREHDLGRDQLYSLQQSGNLPSLMQSTGFYP